MELAPVNEDQEQRTEARNPAAHLREENRQLRELVIQLSRLVLKYAVEHRASST